MNKTDFVENYLHTNDVDLLFVTETWLSKDILDSAVGVKGYTILRRDREHTSGGGVMLFFKDHLQVNEIANPPHLNNGADDFEVLCVDYFDGKHPIRFCCFYVPPRSSQLKNSIKDVCDAITNFQTSFKPYFVLGDFNLPRIDWDNFISLGGESHDYFIDFCILNCFSQPVVEPTHEKGNTLDILLCNTVAQSLLTSCNVLPPLSTTCDHSVISFEVRLRHADTGRPPSCYLDFKNADYITINSLVSSFLSNFNFENSFNDNPQLAYDKFLKYLRFIIDKHVPKKYFNHRSKRPKFIRKLLREKQQLYKKSKTDPNLRKLYKAKSKEYDSSIKQCNKKVELAVCQNPSSRKFFNFYKSKFKSKSAIPPLIDKNNKLHTSDKDKAQCFNSFFQTVFCSNDNPPQPIDRNLTCVMENFLINTSDVSEALDNLNDKMSRTPENIPSYFIKRLKPSITPFLVYLFSFSLTHNFIPNQWKQSIVVPVHKKKSKNSPGNYRPVSQTSAFSRLMESILHKKLLNYFISNHLFSDNQFGFLPLRSSCSQILKCLYDWICNYSQSKTTNIIYTDIKKAFDTVNHTKLLDVIKSYNVNAQTVNWLENFLKSRYQQVIVNEDLSHPILVTSGVPQGSIIGPLLFIIFINDIDTCALNLQGTGGISLFADDTKIYGHNPDKIQDTLCSIGNWFDDRLLNLAKDKCVSLAINPRGSDDRFHIQNTDLDRVESMKDLGVTITSNLKWSQHCNNIYRNASTYSYHILKFTKTNNIWHLLKLFTVYIRPKLEYCTPVWSPNLQKDIHKIEKIQKHFTRKIFQRCNLPYSSYANRLYQLNIKSLEYRRTFSDLMFMFKILNGISGLNSLDYFCYNVQPYNLRNNNFKITTTKSFTSNLWHNSFFNRGVKLWNGLPETIRLETSLSIFKSKLNQFDLNEITKLVYP